MGLIAFLLIVGLIVFGLGVSILGEDKILGFVFGFFGLLFIVLASLIVAPYKIPSGLPLTSIDKGEYQAAFVYVAGENVNIGIEKTDSRENNHERLFLYQFPKSAFDGAINSSAKKLVVIESGGFRKLVLK